MRRFAPLLVVAAMRRRAHNALHLLNRNGCAPNAKFHGWADDCCVYFAGAAATVSFFLASLTVFFRADTAL